METNALLERFLRYVQIWTTSDTIKADAGIIPSAEREFDLARVLEAELKALGAVDVMGTAHCYVCARIPATPDCKSAPAVCFLAHIDTVDSVPGENVKPVLTQKDGDIIISSDGTTLLGADDKAGIAEIMTLAETLLTHTAISHGEIEIIFSPDEETGHGMDFVPVNWMHSKACYTVDGNGLGEFEAECFNAYKSEIVFNGLSKHTGTARPDMVNAVTMAADFVTFLPKHESPETTDGRQGFYSPMGISGHIERSVVTLFLRDFDDDGMKRRLETVEKIAKAIEQKYKGSSVTVTHKKQYVNMKKKLDLHPEVVDLMVQAAKNAGIAPHFKPIRGGTDGSRLTEMGYPAPNIFTGGYDIHSRNEWASLREMQKAVDMLVELAKLWGKQ
jgi:tripeptide aminopeptidase